MKDDILDGVARVICTTFAVDNIVVSRETTAEQVSGWDSLSHAILLMNVERAFKIRFEPSEVVCLENVGELVDVIAEKVG